MAETSERPKQAKWWHTILTAPALLLALGGGLGTAVPAIWSEWKSWRLGIETNRIQIVQEQQTLWKANLDCLRFKPVYTVVIDEGVEVGVTLCASGAALLRYQRSPDVVSFTWIPYPQLGRVPEQQHSQVGDVFIPQSRIVYGGTRCIMHQNLVVLWVLYDNHEHPNDVCHMDYVSTAMGVLLRTQTVPCSTCNG